MCVVVKGFFLLFFLVYRYFRITSRTSKYVILEFLHLPDPSDITNMTLIQNTLLESKDGSESRYFLLQYFTMAFLITVILSNVASP